MQIYGKEKENKGVLYKSIVVIMMIMIMMIMMAICVSPKSNQMKDMMYEGYYHAD